jgi:hypothetical protein
MALKVKAVERLLKFDKESAGKYRYVMKPEMYGSLTQQKVIKEAALRSGVSQGVMKACWDAARKPKPERKRWWSEPGRWHRHRNAQQWWWRQYRRR